MTPRPAAAQSPSAPLVLVLMAGGFSPPPLGLEAGCSVLDLHLTREETVLDRWRSALSTLDRAGLTGERMCLCGGSTPVPQTTLGFLRTIMDRSDYRGPAGALRDACERMAPETTIIAAEAARCCLADLGQMLAQHVRSEADATVARNADESPSGLYVFSRAMLDEVPHVGFMDLKEQWLARLVAKGRRVMVYELAEPGSLPLRTRTDFLRAVRACAGVEIGPEPDSLEPRVLRGSRCAASILCEGAEVAPSAVIVDSVVSAGARVGEGALVARSIVGPGCIVRPGQTVVDAVVGPGGRAEPVTLRGAKR
ncbi:MAG: hypothetical protein IPJ41_15120 [Phycisphaerales bacterium]|nr:hypothetical protein [Phycisphaerales bacterium]